MIIDNDLHKLLKILPPNVKDSLKKHPCKKELIEVVMDLGRRPEARFFKKTEFLSEKTISWDDLNKTIKCVGKFNKDNRAGIEQSLHRISCIRNQEKEIIGITARIGRCNIGSINLIRDVLETDQSLLILGKPGTGKTTLIREISRVLADEKEKRVIVIDSSNEIGGGSNIPHKGLGQARRMFVSRFKDQHSVMIEALENHTPEVIVVDEIGSELEAFAARSIAERGVQLIGTAHGHSLANLLKNPILSDLLGGLQSVTLSDEEAKRRKTQKTILERKTFPTFQSVLELTNSKLWTFHEDVLTSVDSLLRGQEPSTQLRSLEKNNIFTIKAFNPQPLESVQEEVTPSSQQESNKPLSKKKMLEKIQKQKAQIEEEKEFFRSLQEMEPNSSPEISNKEIRKELKNFLKTLPKKKIKKTKTRTEKTLTINSLSLSRTRIAQACQSLGLRVVFTKSLDKVDLILRHQENQNEVLKKEAEKKNIPFSLVKADSLENLVKHFKILLKKKIIS